MGFSASQMHFYITTAGVRNGEFIAGNSALNNAGTLMQLRGEFPPWAQYAENIDPLLLRDGFNGIPFFANMTVAQRAEWLETHMVPNEPWLDDLPLQVRFVTIGGKFFREKLGADIIDMLIKGNPADSEGYWPIQDIYNMFPRAPGSKGKKHTLIFRPGIWHLYVQPEINEFNGIIVDVEHGAYDGRVNRTVDRQLVEVIPVVRPDLIPRLGLTALNGPPLSRDQMLALANQVMPLNPDIVGLIEWMPPSMLKSLLQKVIRTAAVEVEYGGVMYVSEQVLLTAFCLLIVHPGSFNPNIQRFVTGLESATKRVAVSIFEDSYTEDFETLMSMMAAGLSAQNRKGWFPAEATILRWMQMMVPTVADLRLFDYTIRGFNSHQQYPELTHLVISYLLLSEIRSFESDINMVGSIALNNGRAEPITGRETRWLVMPLIHSLDHHSFAEVAHFMPPLFPSPSDSAVPMEYPLMLHNIWEEVTGNNARRGEVLTETALPYQEAQRLCWISKIHTPTPRDVITGKEPFNYQLDPSHLSGMLGPINIERGQLRAVVVLRCDNPLLLTAVRQPNRHNTAQPELSEAEHAFVMGEARRLLEEGMVLRYVPATLPQFKRAMARMVVNSEGEPEDYTITLPGETPQPLAEAFNLTYEFPVHEYMEPTLENALLFTGDGITQNAAEIMTGIRDAAPPQALQRLATYLAANKSQIQLQKISRDGTGVTYAVSPWDTYVNHLLGVIAVLYPAALERSINGWNVKCGPLMWTLREFLKPPSLPVVEGAVWGIPDGRPLWEHQESSVQSMLARHATGRRGHLIWVGVGLGKTKIAMEYMLRIQMPEYCVYTLPPSSVDSIRKELVSYQMAFVELDMRKGGINRRLTPGVVNLVYHDQLRLLQDQLRLHAPNMMFIVDEFHKTLNPTKRTSTALEIARLSHDFVGMSATLI